MPKLNVALIVAFGLGAFAASLPATAQNAAKQMRTRFTQSHGVKSCHYSCPPGENVCPSGETDKNGCAKYYRCFKGTIGNGSCN
jgi:hypothetical protein